MKLLPLFLAWACVSAPTLVLSLNCSLAFLLDRVDASEDFLGGLFGSTTLQQLYVDLDSIGFNPASPMLSDKHCCDLLYNHSVLDSATNISGSDLNVFGNDFEQHCFSWALSPPHKVSCSPAPGTTKPQCNALKQKWASGACAAALGPAENPVRWTDPQTCGGKKRTGDGGCKLWCDCGSQGCQSACEQNGCLWTSVGRGPNPTGFCRNQPGFTGVWLLDLELALLSNSTYGHVVAPTFGLACQQLAQICFPGSALVTTAMGDKRMDELRYYDQVQVVDLATGALRFAPVESFYHVERTTNASFVKIAHGKSGSVTLSRDHLLFVSGSALEAPKDVRAGDVKPGQYVWTVAAHDGLEAALVLGVECVTELGVFAPMTAGAGTLVVNKVLASNYVGVANDHALMHASYWPLRALHRLQQWNTPGALPLDSTAPTAFSFGLAVPYLKDLLQGSVAAAA